MGFFFFFFFVFCTDYRVQMQYEVKSHRNLALALTALKLLSDLQSRQWLNLFLRHGNPKQNEIKQNQKSNRTNSCTFLLSSHSIALILVKSEVAYLLSDVSEETSCSSRAGREREKRAWLGLDKPATREPYQQQWFSSFVFKESLL